MCLNKRIYALSRLPCISWDAWESSRQHLIRLAKWAFICWTLVYLWYSQSSVSTKPMIDSTQTRPHRASYPDVSSCRPHTACCNHRVNISFSQRIRQTSYTQHICDLLAFTERTDRRVMHLLPHEGSLPCSEAVFQLSGRWLLLWDNWPHIRKYHLGVSRIRRKCRNNIFSTDSLLSPHTRKNRYSRRKHQSRKACPS